MSDENATAKAPEKVVDGAGILIPQEDVRLICEPVCAGPQKVGQYDKFLIEWRVVEEGPHKGLKAEQSLGLEDDRYEKTIETLAKIGIAEAELLTKQPTARATLTFGKPRSFTRKSGVTEWSPTVKWFDASRAAGVVDDGLKARILARMKSHKAGKPISGGAAAVDDSPFGPGHGSVDEPGDPPVPF